MKTSGNESYTIQLLFQFHKMLMISHIEKYSRAQCCTSLDCWNCLTVTTPTIGLTHIAYFACVVELCSYSVVDEVKPVNIHSFCLTIVFNRPTFSLICVITYPPFSFHINNCVCKAECVKRLHSLICVMSGLF